MQNDGEYYYWTKGDKEPLGAHFNTLEFTCHCGHPNCIRQRIACALVERLNSLREEIDQPIQVHSGFRCAEKQQDLRNAGMETAIGTSQHELGRAADIAVATGSMHALLQLCKEKFKAVGAAHSFIHVDLRDDRVRYWGYSRV